MLAHQNKQDQPVDEAQLVEKLRRGEESAFQRLIELHHAGLSRVARLYVPDAAVDDVVQETWIGVIRGIERFEQRSSVKTWIYRILINQARKRGPKEKRAIPFSAAGPAGESEPPVSPDRLVHPLLGRNYWPAAPPAWDTEPENRALASELRGVVSRSIAALPPAQREVITLRDVEGWASEEVCDTLGISGVNQRVLLHRARTTVRKELEEYFDGD